MYCQVLFFYFGEVRPSRVQFIAKLTGRDVERRSTTPMNLLRLTAGVLQVTYASSSFVICFIHKTPTMSSTHLLFNTLISGLSSRLSSIRFASIDRCKAIRRHAEAHLCSFANIFCISTLGEDVSAPTEASLISLYRVVQKKNAKSLMHRHFATVRSRIMRFSPKCSEINW